MYFGIIAIIAVVLVASIIKGAPYLPTKTKSVDTTLELSGVKDSERVIDLGSGDGKVVIAFAKTGAETHGYEINPLLVLISRYRIWKRGLSKNAHIHFGSFWSVDISAFNVVTVFGAKHIKG